MKYNVEAQAEVTCTVELTFESQQELDQLIEAFEFVMSRLPAGTLNRTTLEFKETLRSAKGYMYHVLMGFNESGGPHEE